MLTNNYKKWLTHISSDRSSVNRTYKFIDGAEQQTSMANNTAKFLNYSSSIPTTQNYNSTIFVGSGNTTPTREDYKLESIIEENLTVVSANENLTGNNIVLDKTFTYSGTQDITIAEIGLYKKTIVSSTGMYNTICFVREVLDTPITISNGDTFTVTMTIG